MRASSSTISFRQINTLAIPAIFSGIAESVISLTDIAMIGNVEVNSVEALAAAGLVGSFIAGIVWIFAQTETSISSIVSVHLGQNRLALLKSLVPQVLFFNLLLSLIVLALTWSFSYWIFRLYQADGLVFQYAVDYFKIRILGFPLTLLSLTLFGIFRGLQNTYWAMLCAMTAAFLNVVLDYILIYGIDGWIPAYHIQGAAYASLIAQTVMVCMAFYFYLSRTSFRWNLGTQIHESFKRYLSLSFNFVLRAASLNVAFFVANSYATSYGEKEMAAQSILMNIWLFFSFFIDGYANAGNAMGGKLLGEKRYQDLWGLSQRITAYSVVISLILIFLALFFYTEIGWLFNKEPMVLKVFKAVFWIVLILQPINSIAYVYDGFLKGMGEAKYLRNNLIVATFLGFVPTLLICDYLGFRLQGIWISFGIWMLIRSFPLVYYFRRKTVGVAL